MSRVLLWTLALACSAAAQSYTSGQPAEKSALLEKEDTGFLGLEGLNLRLKSDNGFFESDLSGKIDLTFYGATGHPPGLINNDESLVTDKEDLFLDTWIGKSLYVFVDARTDRHENPGDREQVARMEQYFLRFSLPGSFDLSVQFGKFPAVIGNYLPRHETPNDPFLRYPLPYDLPTHLGWRKAQASNHALIAKRDSRHKWDQGLPIIWQADYSTGWGLFGSWKFLNWRFAAMNTAPSDPPDTWALKWDEQEDKFNFMGRVGAVPLFGLEVGLDISRGPYLSRIAEPTLDGNSRSDYDQILYGIDASYAIGELAMFAEAYQNEWEAHNIHGELKTWAWYVEARYKFLPGLFGALRFGRESYSDIRDSDGERKTWDRDYDRFEVGAGYWLKKNLLLRGGVEFNWTEAERDPNNNLYLLGLTLTF